MIDIKDGLKQKSLQLLLNQLKKRHNQDGQRHAHDHEF